MINLYLSDFILGINNLEHNLSLENVAYEFEKLLMVVKDLRKKNKNLVSDVYLYKEQKLYGYSLSDIKSKIIDKNNKGYMLAILTKKQYITKVQPEKFFFNNITYQSSIIKECYTNNGILISFILNNQFINRLPYCESYINIMHQMNDEYICKLIKLDDSFYICKIYLNMFNSGYNLYFHIQAYRTLCDDYISSSNKIDNLIQHILSGNLLEHYDGIHVKYERNGIGVMKENDPMIRIYFMRENKNIYILEITNDHGKNNISNKLESAEQRYKEKEHLKDICDIDDCRCKRKK